MINFFFISTFLSLIYFGTSLYLIAYLIIILFSNKIIIFKRKIYSILFIIVILLVPITSPFIIITYTNYKVQSLSDFDKINYIVNLISNETEYIGEVKIGSIFDYFSISNIYVAIKSLVRCPYPNVYAYFITGVGKCGEVADVSIFLLRQNNISCRKVAFAGENHEFFEVFQNNDWRVYDLGYSNMNNVTRIYRAEDRINRMGSLSYVEGYDVIGDIDLTNLYVNSDLICIKVINNLNEPLRGLSIVLKHRFRGGIFSIPGHNPFITDTNGEVKFNLGKMDYNLNAPNSDNYYWVFINGINSTKTVTSNGLGNVNRIVLSPP
ncbi:MAG: transglutaminase domain-containing protein [Candidatus Bathyarchaeota archaeon]|nr:transglutaminase domain-containing protein [Candidatus Bathyarchaeota archaeon]